MVEHCMEMIECMSASIIRHKREEKPDQLAIEEYTELRQKFIAELIELLEGIGLEVQLNVKEAA